MRDKLMRREMFRESKVVGEIASDGKKETPRGFGMIEEISRNEQKKTRRALHEAHGVRRKDENTCGKDAEVRRARDETENRTGRKRERERTERCKQGGGIMEQRKDDEIEHVLDDPADHHSMVGKDSREKKIRRGPMEHGQSKYKPRDGERG